MGAYMVYLKSATKEQADRLHKTYLLNILASKKKVTK